MFFCLRHIYSCQKHHLWWFKTVSAIRKIKKIQRSTFFPFSQTTWRDLKQVPPYQKKCWFYSLFPNYFHPISFVFSNYLHLHKNHQAAKLRHESSPATLYPHRRPLSFNYNLHIYISHILFQKNISHILEIII